MTECAKDELGIMPLEDEVGRAEEADTSKGNKYSLWKPRENREKKGDSAGRVLDWSKVSRKIWPGQCVILDSKSLIGSV